jgi:hypothetical protein
VEAALVAPDPAPSAPERVRGRPADVLAGAMSTVPVRLPCCGALVRVAVQPSKIEPLQGRVRVEFDPQNVAHTCKVVGTA